MSDKTGLRYFVCKKCEEKADYFVCRFTVFDAESYPGECPFGCVKCDWAEVDKPEWEDAEIE